MDKSLSYKKWFLTAGIFIAISAFFSTTLNLIYRISDYVWDRFNWQVLLVSIIFCVLLGITVLPDLVSAILLITKRDNSVPFVITYSLNTLITLGYNLFLIIGHIIILFDDYSGEILDYLGYYGIQVLPIPLSVLLALSVLLLCILSLVYKNKRCKLLSAWFVPVIIHAGYWLLTILGPIFRNLYFAVVYGRKINFSIIYDSFLSRNVYFSILNISIKLVGLLGVAATFLLCFALYKANKQKAELAEQREQESEMSEDTENTVTNEVSDDSREGFAANDIMSTEPAEPETVETKPVETVVKCSVPTAKHPTAEDLHPCDEILKYKRLLDEGIITKEEFDTKKKQILDL